MCISSNPKCSYHIWGQLTTLGKHKTKTVFFKIKIFFHTQMWQYGGHFQVGTFYPDIHLFLVFPGVCVCTLTRECGCGGQRLTVGDSSIILYLIFWERVPPSAWSSLFWLGWLSREAWESSSLYLPSVLRSQAHTSVPGFQMGARVWA